MRTNLKVPFTEKDDAKKLGAKWDAARKIWYIEDKTDMTPFARWAPSPDNSSAAVTAPPKSAPAQQQQTATKVIVGSAYLEQARICQCLPWEVCDKCQSTALSLS